ncbi:hypothetical protein KVR01_010545 [Diaporthe batatas]|uniref:uncharacterized protein n=1 Tax=Diaporthe batatas TaxID=748121 RepID=UPI001D0451DD|nr:uncharacterized protein KVR01_010545 [Diaporthe batatas]KAG8159908.1 hypothetical protein KVR01_010545 [Diaporthe batatas]
MDLAMSCRALHILCDTYKKQIMAAIRDNMVAPFYEYYSFLGSMCIPESKIKPWADMAPEERAAPPGKSDFAVDVVRHLPRVAEWFNGAIVPTDDVDCPLKEDVCGGGGGGPFCVDPWGASPESGPSGRHWVAVARTHHMRVCCDLLLDTSTGMLSQGRSAFGRRLEVEARPVRECLALRMRWCRELRLVLVPGVNVFHLDKGGGGEEGAASLDAAALEEVGAPVCPDMQFDLAHEVDRKWVRHLYRKFGWPGGDWDKEEGLEAIEEYRERRTAEFDERMAELRRRRDETLRRLGPVVGTLHGF